MKLDLRHRGSPTDAYAYWRRARASFLPAAAIGVVASLLLTPVTGIAVAYAVAYAANAAAIGDGLTRLRVAAERRLPRLSQAAHNVGLGRVPWLGVWAAAAAACVFFATAGVAVVATAAGSVAAIAGVSALAQTSTRSYRSAVLARDRRTIRSAAAAAEAPEPSGPEPIVAAANAPGIAAPLGRYMPVASPRRTVAAVAVGPRNGRGHSGLGD